MLTFDTLFILVKLRSSDIESLDWAIAFTMKSVSLVFYGKNYVGLKYHFYR